MQAFEGPVTLCPCVCWNYELRPCWNSYICVACAAFFWFCWLPPVSNSMGKQRYVSNRCTRHAHHEHNMHVVCRWEGNPDDAQAQVPFIFYPIKTVYKKTPRFIGLVSRIVPKKFPTTHRHTALSMVCPCTTRTMFM